MENSINLTLEEPVCTIKICKEKPFLMITKIVFDEDQEIEARNINSFIIKVVKKVIKTSASEEENIGTSGSIATIGQRIIYMQKLINLENDSIWDEIELSYDIKTFSFIKTVTIFYTNLQPLIKYDSLFSNFKQHLDDFGNSKILFSAPFGQGKTTFIHEYFREYYTEYEVFHLFPVNYSVSLNEDIFQYIKSELLFQLMGKDVQFEFQKFDLKDLLPQFVINNLLKAFLHIGYLMPKIGKSVKEFSKVIESFIKQYNQYQKDIQIDDQNLAEEFCKKIYDKEGSIFEDNFYTQLIRQLIEQIKGNGKTTILIIDDLDRIDPEHIFRILNVFAAHFDSSEYQKDHNSNKFGFDKIILVADYENLKRIFRHRYGINTDYKGYTNKFFSKSVWSFDAKEYMNSISNVFKIKKSNKQLEIFLIILTDLIRTNSISLREFLQFTKIDFSLIFGQNLIDHRGNVSGISSNIMESAYYKYNYFLQLHYLSEIAGIDHTLEMLTHCLNNIPVDNNIYKNNNEGNYNSLVFDCMITLESNGNFETDKTYSHEFEGQLYTFKIIEDSIYSNNPLHRYTVSRESRNIGKNFSGKDFYKILIEVANKFKEVGGITGKKMW